ncbi:hypothetical protein IscW_ISCW017797 [Ixodes scapularis]|uniref:Uncharacterized protein n=1 Tax=Ixodes scapularis TaxID=6945 RepID=B7PJY9_IXOSC|nr:hypothetical protein IscW_ISCW017797 [Ixodes scapularis]|eukprot:XP_002408907.1 hypothetical protein IscW_ISCW017797 [Ixodes scapularis]
MENALHSRDRVGVQDLVLLEDFESEKACVDNLQKRFKEDLIYKPFGEDLARIFRGHRPHPRRPRTPRGKGHGLHPSLQRRESDREGTERSEPVLLVNRSTNGSLLLRNLWNHRTEIEDK